MHRRKGEGHFSSDQGFQPYPKGFGITIRLFILILALLLLMVVSHLISYRKNVKVTTAFENILKEVPHQRAIYGIQTALTDYIMPANDILITDDPTEHARAIELEQKVLKAFAACKQFARAEEVPFIKRIEQDFEQIRFLSSKIMSSDISTKNFAAEMMEKMDQLALSTRDHIEELVKIHHQHMSLSREAAEHAWLSAHIWMIAIFMIATIVGLTIATYISLSILRPLKLLDDSAKQIAEGKMDKLLHIVRKGEITSLTNSFNRMILSLRHQIKTSKTILDAIADPLFTVDMDMNITYFSYACEELTGYTANEAIGKKCSEIFKSNICENQCAIKSSAIKGTPIIDVEAAIQPQKKCIPIMASASSLKDEQNIIMGGCEIFRDISEQKRMLKELKEAEEQLVISEKMAALGRLASCVSHELRNPLAIIQNSTYYLKGKISDQESKIKKHIQIIEHEITGSNKIIDELLGFCRTTKSTLVADDLNAVIDSSLLRIPVRPPVRILTQFSAHLPPVPLDREQIHQVLVNLINNAEQAMSEKGGDIIISTRLKADLVELEVADQGCGIAPLYLQRLFDPFFTTKAKGIGLGLAITKSIIQNHQGNISAKNLPGQGASFLITFPINKSEDMVLND